MADVTVVVPARDAERTLPACLDALAASGSEPGFEVVVIDDGSRDATAELARAHRLRPTVVAGPGRGSYAARNAGAAVATAPVLAFTDADCMPSPGWLVAGLRALDDPSIDLAGGRIGWVATAADGVVARYDRATYLQQDRFVAEQEFAATANLFVRRAVFEAVTGFDPELRSGGDVEFCRRAVAAGHRIGYAPDAIVAHRPRATYAELWRLHRRLGAGWAALHRRGLTPAWWRDPALRTPTLGMVMTELADEPDAGAPLRRRHVLPAHTVARTARVVGRLTGR